MCHSRVLRWGKNCLTIFIVIMACTSCFISHGLSQWDMNLKTGRYIQHWVTWPKFGSKVNGIRQHMQLKCAITLYLVAISSSYLGRNMRVDPKWEAHNGRHGNRVASRGARKAVFMATYFSIERHELKNRLISLSQSCDQNFGSKVNISSRTTIGLML